MGSLEWPRSSMERRCPRKTSQRLLHRRYRALAARGKPKQHIVTAVARELTGFLWAALTQ
jgi:hypothetical protein